MNIIKKFTAEAKDSMLTCMALALLLYFSGCGTVYQDRLEYETVNVSLHVTEEAVAEPYSSSVEPTTSAEETYPVSDEQNSTDEEPLWIYAEPVDAESAYYEFWVEMMGAVNGMVLVEGADESGDPVVGWVHLVEIQGEQTSTVEEALDLRRRLEERFRETGQYSTPLNVYSDEYATNVIGVFHLVDFPEGQAITHGTPGIIYGSP